MGQSKRGTKVILIASLILAPLLINVIWIEIYPLSSKDKEKGFNQTKFALSTSADENMSISAQYPKFIWIKGSAILEIRSNISGSIQYTLTDSSGGKYFDIKSSNFDLEDDNSKKEYSIDIDPHLMSLPGKYNIFLIVSYFNETGAETNGGEQFFDLQFDVILGLGDVYLSLLLIIFGTAVLIILTGKTEIEVDQAQTSPQGGTPAQIETVSDAPPGKIKCPHCKELIEEGLTFCPECGHRIPEFLRFNPNQQNQ